MEIIFTIMFSFISAGITRDVIPHIPAAIMEKALANIPIIIITVDVARLIKKKVLFVVSLTIFIEKSISFLLPVPKNADLKHFAL